MRLLETQEQFEELWFHTPERTPHETMRASDLGWIIYFTAAWCGPCKRLDCEALDHAAAERGLTLWKCDDTVNSYTGGYCSVNSFPTFAYFHPKKIVSMFKSSDTEQVKQWIGTL